MARIRTVKPEFLRHSGLYRLEVRSGLPCRLAFLGLWTAADREGRFKWRPEELKFDALPHDPVDFALVMETLRGGGHIVMYEVAGKLYGFIPSWLEHQQINNREAKSSLPEPTDEAIHAAAGHTSGVTAITVTRHGNAQGEGKGREGKGKGREGVSQAAAQPARKQAKEPSPTSDTWDAYATAYEARYQVAPARSAAVNGQLARLVSLIPSEEAPQVATFYLSHDNGLYVNAQHPVNLLLRDAQSLRTQMLSGKKVGIPAASAAKSFREREHDEAAARAAAWNTSVAAKPRAPGQNDRNVIDVTATSLD